MTIIKTAIALLLLAVSTAQGATVGELVKNSQMDSHESNIYFAGWRDGFSSSTALLLTIIAEGRVNEEAFHKIHECLSSMESSKLRDEVVAAAFDGLIPMNKSSSLGILEVAMQLCAP